MKFFRYGERDNERPGVIDAAGMLRDLSSIVDDITGATLPRLMAMSAADIEGLPIIDGSPRLGAPVGNVGKFVCIGLNYHDHAKETGNPVPAHPIVFMKATSSINGPNDDVVLPRGSTHSDWEIELGIVIGKAAKYVSAADATDYIAGYCAVNDVSERFFQTRLTGQWTKGKSCDSFGPIGPWLVSADEIADPQNLELTLDVNGERMQSGNTADMIFSIGEIIEHLSGLMTLHPGDIIATGTPAGVGSGKKPAAIFLKPGDVMQGSIAGLGSQNQSVVADPADR
ncbi:fumarylacetoacetate hydrolase family protein [Alphaproteobacteria bacterium]|nr:fumarylacetoacetate hydrolase family protein [Alphaproteobacteria bacterium]